MKSVYLILLALSLSSCIPALILGGGTGGVVAAQERSPGNAVDDAGVRLTINKLYLEKDTHDLFRNVDIRVTEGRVLLTGDVDKPETAIEAVNLAWKAKGVKEVINEIQVNDKTGFADYARDVWISTQIRSKLLFEKNLRSVNYNVETVNGVVYLMGIAQNQAELDKATYIASITSYVKQVISHVILKDDPRRPK
jgi:osmotically-inducible protein OsmY